MTEWIGVNMRRSWQLTSTDYSFLVTRSSLLVVDNIIRLKGIDMMPKLCNPLGTIPARR